MKITQSWKRNAPTTDGYSLTVTYVYSSKYLHEIEDIERKLPKGMIVIDTDKSQRAYPLEQEIREIKINSREDTCKNCPELDVNYNSDESYCNLADSKKVQLKRGQHKPEWCPKKKWR